MRTCIRNICKIPTRASGRAGKLRSPIVPGAARAAAAMLCGGNIALAEVFAALEADADNFVSDTATRNFNGNFVPFLAPEQGLPHG